MMTNLQTLKWCRGAGVGVSWNLLTGFDGETVEDYEAMVALLPKLAHLEPPMFVGQVRVDRFSPMFLRPEDFGMSKLTPHASYEHVFPRIGEGTHEIAYFFEGSRNTPLPSESFIPALLAAVVSWRQSWISKTLERRVVGGRAHVIDTRRALVEHVLERAEDEILFACDRAASVDSVAELVMRHAACDLEVFQSALHRLLQAELVIAEGSRILSLVLVESVESPRSDS